MKKLTIRQNRRKIVFPPNYTVTRAILDILWELAEATGPFGSPYRRMKQSFRRTLGVPEPPRWRLNQALRYLEKHGQVEMHSRGEELFIKLLQKGRLLTLLGKLSTEFKTQKSWDGKWRLMIWDIPESSRVQRDKIRFFCKRLGFYQLQKSVFITPSPLPPAAVVYLKESGLWNFIRFLRVDKMDDDQILRKHFRLKAKN